MGRHPMMMAKMEQIKKRDELLHPINAALWNDPFDAPGEGFNRTRGTGMLFGPDVCHAFLQKEGLQLLVRSHEQADHGYHWPYGDGAGCLTVFSASNYAKSYSNRGALVRLGAAGSAPPLGATLGTTGDLGDKSAGALRAAAGSDPPTPVPEDDEDEEDEAAPPPPKLGLGGGSRGPPSLGGKSCSDMTSVLMAMESGDSTGGSAASSSSAPPPPLGSRVPSADGKGAGGLEEASSRAKGEDSLAEGSVWVDQVRAVRKAAIKLLPDVTHCWYAFPYGALCCESFSAAAIKPLRRAQRRTHEGYGVLLANAEPFREACMQAEAAATGGEPESGVLTLAAVISACGTTLSIDAQRTQSFGRFLSALLADGDYLAKHGRTPSEMGGVMFNTSTGHEHVPPETRLHYHALFDRVTLANPQLRPLFEVHMYLLALLYRLDTYSDGHVTIGQFALACDTLHVHFPDEAALCADPTALRQALGSAGVPVDRPAPAAAPANPAEAPAAAPAAAAAAAAPAAAALVPALVPALAPAVGDRARVLSIGAISAQFAVCDTRRTALVSPLPPTPREVDAMAKAESAARAALRGDAADAEVSSLGLPGGAPASKKKLRKEETSMDSGRPWHYDIDGYSRMAPLYHALGQKRIADLATDVVVDAKTRNQARQSLAPVLSPASSSGGSPKASRARGSVFARRRVAEKQARRGSIPYSVIAAHLDQVRPRMLHPHPASHSLLLMRPRMLHPCPASHSPLLTAMRVCARGLSGARAATAQA